MVTSSTAQTEKRMRKILIMGLPGAGKTTLATSLAPLLNAVVFNADAVRANISCDLGFSHADRIEQARRMGWPRPSRGGWGHCHRRFHLPNRGDARRFWRGIYDLAQPHQQWPLRGHQSHVRSAHALRSSRQRRGHAAILGRASACPPAPLVRPRARKGRIRQELAAGINDRRNPHTLTCIFGGSRGPALPMALGRGFSCVGQRLSCQAFAIIVFRPRYPATRVAPSNCCLAEKPVHERLHEHGQKQA